MTELLAIGFNGRFFPNNWRPALQELAFAEQHGFRALQFPGREEGLAAVHLGSEPGLIGQRLRAAGIIPVMELLLRIDATGRTAAGRSPLEVLQANLPAILELQCQCVHWHLVPTWHGSPAVSQELEAALAEQLAQAVALAQQHGFRFGFEHNDPEFPLFATPDACQRVLHDIPGLGFVWDLNHTRPEDLAAFQSLTPRMTLLHVSDTPLPEVNHHLPLGLGNIDFARYCQTLREAGFFGPAILEIGGLPKSGGYGRDTDAALVDSADRLRQASLA